MPDEAGGSRTGGAAGAPTGRPAGEARAGPGPGAWDRSGEPRPRRSHWVPRTPVGRVAVVLFLVLLALAEPPVTHSLINRITPTVLGMPFLYAWLLAVYVAMCGVLAWAAWKTPEPGAGRTPGTEG